MSLDHPGGQAEPARPFLIGDAVRLRVAAQEQRRMGHGSRRWEWYGAEPAPVPERTAGYHEGGACTAPFQVQPERLRELLTVVTPRTATHPVRFSLVKVSSVHDRVVDQPAAHSAAGVRLGLNLAQPCKGLSGYVGRAEIRDDMQQAGVVHGEGNRRLILMKETLGVAVYLLDNAALLEQL